MIEFSTPTVETVGYIEMLVKKKTKEYHEIYNDSNFVLQPEVSTVG